MNVEDLRFKAKIKGQDELFEVMDVDIENKEITYEVEFKKGEYINAISYFEDIEALLPYTGFKDKNDEPIYEGDIIKSKYNKCIVYWNTLEGQWWAKTIEEDNSFTLNEFDAIGEIIGNIYENKELLKKEVE